ncbi:hypothetical protein D3C75_1347450 [compost metagenome]
MGRKNKIRAALEMRRRGKRLDVEDVQRGAAKLPAAQGACHGGLVNNAATRGVDQDGARPHGLNARCIQQIARRFQ